MTETDLLDISYDAQDQFRGGKKRKRLEYWKQIAPDLGCEECAEVKRFAEDALGWRVASNQCVD